MLNNPLSREPGSRLYKTRDLAKYWADDNIEFLGKIDHQVKVRGFRIELGEIETMLAQHPGVRDRVVVAREDSPGEKRLVAYLVVDVENGPTPGELLSFLKEKVPNYMMPSAFLNLERFPSTPSGKIDRRALPIPDAVREVEEAYVEPQSEVERAIAGI